MVYCFCYFKSIPNFLHHSVLYKIVLFPVYFVLYCFQKNSKIRIAERKFPAGEMESLWSLLRWECWEVRGGVPLSPLSSACLYKWWGVALGRVSLTSTLREQRPGQRPGDTGENDRVHQFIFLNIQTLFNNRTTHRTKSQRLPNLSSTVSVNVSLLNVDWSWCLVVY